MGSSFIHLIRTDSNVFFLMAEYYSIVYMYHSFLIHSSAVGHLGCFHVLAIINSAANPSILALEIPGTEEPGRLPSMGSESQKSDATKQQHPHPRPNASELS